MARKKQVPRREAGYEREQSDARSRHRLLMSDICARGCSTRSIASCYLSCFQFREALFDLGTGSRAVWCPVDRGEQFVVPSLIHERSHLNFGRCVAQREGSCKGELAVRIRQQPPRNSLVRRGFVCGGPQGKPRQLSRGRGVFSRPPWRQVTSNTSTVLVPRGVTATPVWRIRNCLFEVPTRSIHRIECNGPCQDKTSGRDMSGTNQERPRPTCLENNLRAATNTLGEARESRVRLSENTVTAARLHSAVSCVIVTRKL